jgi:SOS-response transcriptional repressor LexA
MLTGEKLGTAIEQARKKKKVTKKAFADAMGVKPASVQTWVKHGRIAKERINDLVAYFSDVVGPDHWGLDFSVGITNGGDSDSDPISGIYASAYPISPSDEPQRRAHNPALIADMPEKSGTMIGNDDAPRRKLPDSSHSIRNAGDNYTAGPDLKPRLYPEISWVQAGMWTETADNFVLTEDTKKYQCHIDLGEDGFVLRVDGQSMTAPPGVFPTFPQGLLLFVRPHEDAVPGKFVIVRRNGNTATFKKLVIIDGELYLEALNPDWPHQYMPVQEDDVFCGVVMHAGFDLA